jgi:cytochrome P450
VPDGEHLTVRAVGSVHQRLARASALSTARIGLAVLAPVLAQGVIVRRPRMLALAERLDLDRRAGWVLQAARDRYGAGVLRLGVPGRSIAVVLSTDGVRRLLEDTPAPFTPASREKVAALAHFQPDGVLISRGRLRTDRRRLNESVLDTDRPVHRLAGPIGVKVRDEAGAVLAAVEHAAGRLDWDTFAAGWWRLVRRIVLGDAARDDDTITDLLTRLRQNANWAYLRPRRTDVRDELTTRLRGYVAAQPTTEPDSLAGLLATTPAPEQACPVGQIPHWLFAFDAAGIAAYRTLALLAAHPAVLDRARQELGGSDPALPYLRACVLEAVRLWPTTLVVLRDSTETTEWAGGALPPGTAFLIVSSLFHRDERTLPYADRFTPEIWLDGRADDNWSLFPFSAGSAVCPGRNLVLLVASQLVAALLGEHDVQLLSDRLDPARPLPRSLDHTALRMAVGSRRR